MDARNCLSSIRSWTHPHTAAATAQTQAGWSDLHHLQNFVKRQSLLISRIELETKRCQHVTPPFLSGSVIRHKLFGMVAPEIFQRPGARFFQWRW
jgi:hypothetical protein